jgi:hypothetical protein
LCALTLILGLYIGNKEINQRPQPRAIFNLAGAYYECGNIDIAKILWNECAHYNAIYKTNVRLDTDQGQWIVKAQQNLVNMEFAKDNLWKRGRN